jgi:hypothetical protein
MQTVEYRVFWLVSEPEITTSLRGLEGLAERGPLLPAHANIQGSSIGEIRNTNSLPSRAGVRSRPKVLT